MRTDSNLSPSELMSMMLPLSCSTYILYKTVEKYDNTTVLSKSRHIFLYFWPDLPLSIRLLHNLSGRPLFSPKKQGQLFALASVSILLLWGRRAYIYCSGLELRCPLGKVGVKDRAYLYSGVPWWECVTRFSTSSF